MIKTRRTLLALALALPTIAAGCAGQNRAAQTAPNRDIRIVHAGASSAPATPASAKTAASGPSAGLGEFDPFVNDIVRRDDSDTPRIMTARPDSGFDRPPHRTSPGSEPGPSQGVRSGVEPSPSGDVRSGVGLTRGSTGRGRLIGLYGEIAPGTAGESDPYDGNRNLTQVTFADEGACFDPDVDPTGGWLVFASTRHRETADIYIKTATGKTITQITADPADDLMPAFDPTGRRIAFASNRDGDWNIYITTTQGGRDVQLTSGSDDELHPTWSPDGRHIAYCRFGAQSGRWEIWVVEVDAPGTQSFLDYGLFPRWSPDVAHSRLLFQRSRQRGSRYHAIWTIDFVNGEAMYPTEIASAANAAIINPTWSPDGRRIAFVTIVDPETDAGTPAQSDLWIINADGSSRTMLTNGDFANYQPVWASTGTVYFVSNRSGNENIWAVSPTPAPAPAPAPGHDPRDGGDIATVDPDGPRP